MQGRLLAGWSLEKKRWVAGGHQKALKLLGREAVEVARVCRARKALYSRPSSFRLGVSKNAEQAARW